MLIHNYFVMVFSSIILCALNVVHYSFAKRGTIVGGTISGPHDFPYSAFLGVWCRIREGYEFWVCGSSVITQRVLLTAGHCIYCDYIKIKARLGNANKSAGWVRFSTKRKLHEFYNNNQLTNDIGLVVVAPFPLGYDIQRVALMKNPPLHDLALVTGWGISHESHQHTEQVMRFVRQKIVSDRTCLSALKSKPRGTLCARHPYKAGHATVGDSGGALVLRNYIQVGIVSYRVPGIKKSLTVYTSVSYFLTWIRYKIRQLYCLKPKWINAIFLN